MLSRDLRKRGYGISTPRSTRALNAVATDMNYKSLEDLFAAVGAGKVQPRAVGNKVQAILDPRPQSAADAKAEAIASVARASVPRATAACSSRGRRAIACSCASRIAATP